MFPFRNSAILTTLGSVSMLWISGQSLAIAASKTYTGADVNVIVSCVSVSHQSQGSYTLDGRRSGRGVASILTKCYHEPLKPLFGRGFERTTILALSRQIAL